MPEGWKELRLRKLGLAITILAATLFAAVTLPLNNWLTNTGFLVIGAVVSVYASVAVEAVRRQTERIELANVLYVELAQHVARLCFDAEAPWNSVRGTVPEQWPLARVAKFAPEQPHVYLACLPQLAMLGNGPPARLMQFHYRVAALRRDIKNASEETHGALVAYKSLKLIAKRQLEALGPGVAAMDELRQFVREHSAIDAAAISSFDSARDTQPTLAFRERIAAVLAN